MKKIIIFLILAFLALVVIFVFADKKSPSGLKTIKINGAEIYIEIAQTPLSHAKGLSDRPSLPQNQGLLFLFDTPGQYSFWMKDMLIPLDFLWIIGDTIIQINENVKPQDFQPPKTLTPSQAVDKVLELNAGAVERLKIKTGDKIEF